MTLRLLKKQTATDVRVVAKHLHKHANRIETGDFSALVELISAIPMSLHQVHDRYCDGVKGLTPEEWKKL